MKEQKHLSPAGATRASILMKTGACVGGTILGYTSQWFGRRRMIVCAALKRTEHRPARRAGETVRVREGSRIAEVTE